MPTFEEIEALNKALAEALGELRVLRTERDLLKEQLNRFKRQLFDAKTEKTVEFSVAHQKDLFFNDAEVEGAQAQAAAEQTEDDKIDVLAHQRAKRGHKPLDPALPREVVRHELPEAERVCPHDGAALSEIGVEVSEQLDIVPQQVRLIRHERVKYACLWRPCWGASAARTCRTTRWPPASCGWARRCSRCSSCRAMHCWTRPASAATRPSAGAQGAGAQGPGQELHVGHVDGISVRSHGLTAASATMRRRRQKGRAAWASGAIGLRADDLKGSNRQ